MKPSTRFLVFRRAPVLLVAAALSFGARPARATPVDARAVELYRQSVERYREGRWAEAADLLREAYRREPDPVLLYDLGRACERMNDARCAIDAYEGYLARASPPDRAAIEQRIAAYKTQLAEGGEPQAAPAPASAPVERRPSPVPWIVAGTGVVAVGAGIALLLVADAKHEDAVSAETQQRSVDLEASADRTATIGNVTLVAGGAVAAAGIVWGLLDLRASSRVSARAGLGALSVRVVF